MKLGFTLNINTRNKPIIANGEIVNNHAIIRHSGLSNMINDSIDILGNDGAEYRLFGCRYMGGALISDNMHLTELELDRVIKAYRPDREYDILIFNFIGMDNLIDTGKLLLDFNDKTNELKLKYMQYYKEHKIDNTLYKVESRIIDIDNSDFNTEFSIKITNAIKIEFNTKYTIEDLIEKALRIKYFFEWITGLFIEFDIVEFASTSNKVQRSNLVFDKKLRPGFITDKNYIMRHNIRPMLIDKWTSTELFSWLNSWILNCEKYMDALNIWNKSICNRYVSNEDRFLWKCQAFELMCELNESIVDKARNDSGNEKNKNWFPNLKYLIVAVQEKYDIPKIYSIEKLQELVDVRNACTHNNPKKKVNNAQKNDALKLITYYFNALVTRLLDLKEIKLDELPNL